MSALGLGRGDYVLRSAANWACALVVVLCLSIALGWLLGSPALQLRALYEGPPMYLSVALALVAVASALLVRLRLGRTARARLLRTVGGAVALFGLLYSLEVLTGMHLGVDFAQFHGRMDLVSLHPGRPSPNSSVAMLLLGLAVWGLSLKPRPRIRLGVLMLGGAVGTIGIVGVSVYAFALPFFNLWPEQTSLAAPTAVAYMFLAASVLVAARDWSRDPSAQLSDFQRVTATALSVLVVVSLVIGLSGLAVMQRQAQRVEERAMRSGLLQRTHGVQQDIERALTLAGERARELSLGAASSGSRQESYAVVGSELRDHASVWKDATALAYRDPSGTLQAKFGKFVQGPKLPLELTSPEPASAVLVGDVGPLLQTSWTLYGKDGVAGEVEMQQPLPGLDALLSMPPPWKQARVALCERSGSACFDVHEGHFTPLPEAHLRNLRTQLGATSFDKAILGHDARGQPCVLTKEPLAGTDLALVLTVPAFEVYAPVRAALGQLAAIVLGCIVLGALVMRRLLYAITQRLAAALERAGSHYAHFLAAADSAQDALCLLEPVQDSPGQVTDFRIRFANAAFAQQFKRSAVSVTNASMRELMQSVPEFERYFSACAGVWNSGKAATVECEPGSRGDCGRAWSHVRCFMTRSADGVFVVERDISADKQHVEHLTTLAMTDPLTGLANRRAFEKALTAACARLRGDGDGLAVVFCDIDDFKMLNDARGHAYGDDLLVRLAQALKAAVRKRDVVARLAGDEFVILLENLQSPQEVREVVDMLRAQVDRAVPVHDSVHPLQVSVGYAMSFEPGVLPSEMLARADAAMYAQKEARKRARRGIAAAGGTEFQR